VGIKTALMGMMLVALAASSASSRQQEGELDDIREAIKERRARWSARETSISTLAPGQRKMRLGVRPQTQVAPVAPAEAPLGPSFGSSLDWRNFRGVSVVTPVKDQGACGSCWAFSTAAGLESQIMMMGGGVPDAAEQILVSCSGAGTCNGGYPTRASIFMQTSGIAGEEKFPYSGTDQSCRAALEGWQRTAAKLGSYYSIPARVNDIKHALAAYGPLPTTFDVYTDFYSYAGGVYSYAAGALEGAHAVLIVGYDDAAQAFTVKNSWGKAWGENGYFRIAYTEVGGSAKFGRETLAYTMPCLYTLSPPFASLPAAGGRGTFTVKASGPACAPWTVTSRQKWITITAGATGTNTGTVSYVVSANASGQPREGKINVSASSNDPGRRGRLQKRGQDPQEEEPMAAGLSRFSVLQE